MSLPREIGKHPETGEPITAGLGRFGPFVRHEKTYASLEAGDEVFDIGLNRAVTLIAEKIAKGPSGRRFGADPGKPLGDHPTLGGVAVKSGRYGAYVTAGRRQRHDPERQDAGHHHAAGSHRADRRTRGEGWRQAEAGRQESQGGEAGQGRGRMPKAPKPAKKAAAKKSAAKPKSDAVSKARAPVTPAAKTSPAKPAPASKTAAKKSAGKARG